MKKIILSCILVVFLSGCSSIAEKTSTPYAASLGQLADIGTTSYALFVLDGFREGNTILAGANGLSAVGWIIFAAKPILPMFFDDWFNQESCEVVTTTSGMVGWGAAGWNVAVMAGATVGAGIGAGIGTAILLWPWLDKSSELHCKR